MPLTLASCLPGQHLDTLASHESQRGQCYTRGFLSSRESYRFLHALPISALNASDWFYA